MCDMGFRLFHDPMITGKNCHLLAVYPQKRPWPHVAVAQLLAGPVVSEIGPVAGTRYVRCAEQNIPGQYGKMRPISIDLNATIRPSDRSTHNRVSRKNRASTSDS